MKKILTALLAIGLFAQTNLSYAQCEIIATALPSDITCGTCITLTAFGEGQGNSVFTENFNGGAPTGWQSTAQATYTNPCDPSGVDGTTHLWMGDATGVPRQITTIPFNFSTATAGATICFDMIFAEQGDASPCEGPDEPDEGVYLQYSINNGATWVTINYFDPNGGNDASLINWNNWCFALPLAALTANTQIRWFQDNDSGADYDHWGLDNINIYFNDPTFNITWQHDGYSYGVGNSGGPNPTQVCPQTTTTYNVVMTNGTTTCTDQVTVNVVPPVFRVNAGTDTTICPGQCVDLNGEASIVVSPAKTPTYSNSEVSVLTGLPSAADLVNILLPCVSFGGCTCPNGSTVPFLGTCPAIFTGTLSMNINITDLNTTVLQNGELTSVCIGDAGMISGDLSPFQVSLTCPSGTTIILANAGSLTGTTLTNTCFDLVSTTPIASASSPYNGTFQPVQSLTNLNGCTSNGVWTLTFSGTFNLSGGTVPVGFLNGWDITFDDPEIIYTGDYTWSPVTNMTNPTTLTPTVCPTTTTSYVLNVTDSAGCASANDMVTVNVTNNNCCPFEISYTSIQPACGSTNGSIDITVANGSGNYTYAWLAGPTTEDRSNLAAGTYTITVTDIGLGCQKDTTITLVSPNSPVLNDTTIVGTTCGLSNGSCTLVVSGGTAPISYSLGSGTPQLGATFSNLAGGTYTFNYADANLCSGSVQVTIPSSSAPVIDSINLVQTSCGLSNGSIQIYATNGSNPLTYSINNGANTSLTSLFSNLSANTYNIVVSDALGCSVSDVAILDPSSAPVISNVTTVSPSCGVADGEINISASGGQAPLSYSIDNGVNFQASGNFTSLVAAGYVVVVSDANNCSVTQNQNLNSANAPIIDNVASANPSCANNDGSIIITASGGAVPLQYSIDNGVNFQATGSFSVLSAGNYTIVVEDNLGCQSSQQLNLQLPAGPSINSVNASNASCGGSNGSLVINASGGVAPLAYSVDNGVNFQVANSFNGLAAGTYAIIVEDDNACTSSQTVTITNTNGPSFNNLIISATTCGVDNGAIEINVSSGTAPFEYSIDNGLNFQNGNIFNNLAAGSYTIVVREINNTSCFIDSIVVIGGSAALIVDSLFVQDESCFGANDGAIVFRIISGTAPFTSTPVGILNNHPSLPGFLVLNELSAGTYNFGLTDANSCTFTTQATIASGLVLSVSTIADTSILEGNTVSLNTQGQGSNNANYTWTPNTGLSCSDCQNPIATITGNIQYLVSYTDLDFGCEATDEVNISIIYEEPFCLFPTAFSPNNDLVNEGYGAICDNLVYIELKIYNRWGELIYQASDNNDLLRWDGTYKGKDAPLDVYIYVANLEYINGKTETQSGNFTLIR